VTAEGFGYNNVYNKVEPKLVSQLEIDELIF